MNERTRKKIVYLSLVLAVIWGIYNFPSQNESPNINETVPTIQPLATSSPVTENREMIDVKQKMQAPWGEDPFQSAGPKFILKVDQVNPRWRLSGIVYNSHNPLAIVNNQPVRVGDEINNATVVSINASTITLDYNGDRVTLNVTKG